MTFTPRDLKDVANLVARKLEKYMNKERREDRFQPAGCYRTTTKMKNFDLLQRVMETSDLDRIPVPKDKKQSGQKSTRQRSPELKTKKGSKYRRKECEKEKGRMKPEMAWSHERATDLNSDERGKTETPKERQTNVEENGEIWRRLTSDRSESTPEAKVAISPKLKQTSRTVVAKKEAVRLSEYASHVFEEQPIDKLQVIHRYRPNSTDIPHITENGKVHNYSRHVGSALHAKRYVDYYMKEGLHTGNKECSKRLQHLKERRVMSDHGSMRDSERSSLRSSDPGHGGKGGQYWSEDKTRGRLPPISSSSAELPSPRSCISLRSSDSSLSGVSRYTTSSFGLPFTSKYQVISASHCPQIIVAPHPPSQCYPEPSPPELVLSEQDQYPSTMQRRIRVRSAQNLQRHRERETYSSRFMMQDRSISTTDLLPKLDNYTQTPRTVDQATDCTDGPPVHQETQTPRSSRRAGRKKLLRTDEITDDSLKINISTEEDISSSSCSSLDKDSETTSTLKDHSAVKVCQTSFSLASEESPERNLASLTEPLTLISVHDESVSSLPNSTVHLYKEVQEQSLSSYASVISVEEQERCSSLGVSSETEMQTVENRAEAGSCEEYYSYDRAPNEVEDDVYAKQEPVLSECHGDKPKDIVSECESSAIVLDDDAFWESRGEKVTSPVLNWSLEAAVAGLEVREDDAVSIPVVKPDKVIGKSDEKTCLSRQNTFVINVCEKSEEKINDEIPTEENPETPLATVGNKSLSDSSDSPQRGEVELKIMDEDPRGDSVFAELDCTQEQYRGNFLNETCSHFGSDSFFQYRRVQSKYVFMTEERGGDDESFGDSEPEPEDYAKAEVHYQKEANDDTTEQDVEICRGSVPAKRKDSAASSYCSGLRAVADTFPVSDDDKKARPCSADSLLTESSARGSSKRDQTPDSVEEHKEWKQKLDSTQDLIDDVFDDAGRDVGKVKDDKDEKLVPYIIAGNTDPLDRVSLSSRGSGDVYNPSPGMLRGEEIIQNEDKTDVPLENYDQKSSESGESLGRGEAPDITKDLDNVMDQELRQGELHDKEVMLNPSTSSERGFGEKFDQVSLPGRGEVEFSRDQAVLEVNCCVMHTLEACHDVSAAEDHCKCEDDEESCVDCFEETIISGGGEGCILPANGSNLVQDFPPVHSKNVDEMLVVEIENENKESVKEERSSEVNEPTDSESRGKTDAQPSVSVNERATLSSVSESKLSCSVDDHLKLSACDAESGLRSNLESRKPVISPRQIAVVEDCGIGEEKKHPTDIVRTSTIDAHVHTQEISRGQLDIPTHTHILDIIERVDVRCDEGLGSILVSENTCSYQAKFHNEETGPDPQVVTSSFPHLNTAVEKQEFKSNLVIDTGFNLDGDQNAIDTVSTEVPDITRSNSLTDVPKIDEDNQERDKHMEAVRRETVLEGMNEREYCKQDCNQNPEEVIVRGSMGDKLLNEQQKKEADESTCKTDGMFNTADKQCEHEGVSFEESNTDFENSRGVETNDTEQTITFQGVESCEADRASAGLENNEMKEACYSTVLTVSNQRRSESPCERGSAVQEEDKTDKENQLQTDDIVVAHSCDPVIENNPEPELQQGDESVILTSKFANNILTEKESGTTEQEMMQETLENINHSQSADIAICEASPTRSTGSVAESKGDESSIRNKKQEQKLKDASLETFVKEMVQDILRQIACEEQTISNGDDKEPCSVINDQEKVNDSLENELLIDDQNSKLPPTETQAEKDTLQTKCLDCEEKAEPEDEGKYVSYHRGSITRRDAGLSDLTVQNCSETGVSYLDEYKHHSVADLNTIPKLLDGVDEASVSPLMDGHDEAGAVEQSEAAIEDTNKDNTSQSKEKVQLIEVGVNEKDGVDKSKIYHSANYFYSGDDTEENKTVDMTAKENSHLVSDLTRKEVHPGNCSSTLTAETGMTSSSTDGSSSSSDSSSSTSTSTSSSSSTESEDLPSLGTDNLVAHALSEELRGTEVSPERKDIMESDNVIFPPERNASPKEMYVSTVNQPNTNDESRASDIAVNNDQNLGFALDNTEENTEQENSHNVNEEVKPENSSDCILKDSSLVERGRISPVDAPVNTTSERATTSTEAVMSTAIITVKPIGCTNKDQVISEARYQIDNESEVISYHSHLVDSELLKQPTTKEDVNQTEDEPEVISCYLIDSENLKEKRAIVPNVDECSSDEQKLENEQSALVVQADPLDSSLELSHMLDISQLSLHPADQMYAKENNYNLVLNGNAAVPATTDDRIQKMDNQKNTDAHATVKKKAQTTERASPFCEIVPPHMATKTEPADSPCGCERPVPEAHNSQADRKSCTGSVIVVTGDASQESDNTAVMPEVVNVQDQNTATEQSSSAQETETSSNASSSKTRSVQPADQGHRIILVSENKPSIVPSLPVREHGDGPKVILVSESQT